MTSIGDVIIKFEQESKALVEKLIEQMERIADRMPEPAPGAAPKPKRAATKKADRLAGFETFWRVWPRKVARKAAETKWAALAPSVELVATIIKDVINRSKTDGWLKDDGQFIPHPATYLFGRRWEDADAPARPSIVAGGGADDEGHGYD